jgi:hypothetical protein
MNATLERLVALKADATTPITHLEYVDQLWTDTVYITRRPGDVERCAIYIDELVAEIATTRATAATSAPPAPERAPAGTGAHTATHNPHTGTGSHQTQETP